MSPSRPLAALALVLSLSGCSGEDEGAIRPSTTLGGLSRCDGARSQPIEGTVRVRMLVGAGIPDQTLDAIVGDVAAFLQPYGIDLTRGATATIPDAPLLGTTLAEIESRLRAGATTADTAAGRRIVESTALRPVRGFLARHSIPPRPGLDLVVLTRVTDDRAVAASLIGDIAGLGLAPGVAAIPHRALPRSFTPTAFVAIEELRLLEPAEAAIVVAHEVAHALGLGHDPREWNLMNPSIPDCLPGLSPDQAARIASSPAVRPR